MHYDRQCLKETSLIYILCKLQNIQRFQQWIRHSCASVAKIYFVICILCTLLNSILILCRSAIAWATWDLIAMVENGRHDGPATHAVTFVWNGHEVNWNNIIFSFILFLKYMMSTLQSEVMAAVFSFSSSAE